MKTLFLILLLGSLAVAQADGGHVVLAGNSAQDGTALTPTINIETAPASLTEQRCLDAGGSWETDSAECVLNPVELFTDHRFRIDSVQAQVGGLRNQIALLEQQVESQRQTIVELTNIVADLAKLAAGTNKSVLKITQALKGSKNEP